MYHQRVYGVVYGILHHVEDSQEVSQQVWVKVWKKLDAFKSESGFFTWLYRIASNASLDFIRRRARIKESALEDGVEAFADAQPERPASVVSRPDREMEREEVREVFAKAVQELTPEHRAAITLREVEGLSYEEIAKALGCRKGTVMSRIFYARKQLQERLKDLL